MSEIKVAFITGSSSGIGAALAQEFAQRGYRVAVAARRLDKLEAVAHAIHQQGGEALPVLCDVLDQVSLNTAVEKVLAKWGRIDIAVANAGFGIVGQVMDISAADYERQFNTNIYGVLRTAWAVVPALKKTKGVLGIVGSVNGYVALPGNSAYAMSKFAVRALADSLRGELVADGVKVTHIAPGFVESEIRTVDNQGVFHPHAKDPIPTWLRMPAATAARIIARALVWRCNEVVVTFHGKLAVFLERHFTWFVRAIIGRGLISARGEPKKNKALKAE